MVASARQVVAVLAPDAHRAGIGVGLCAANDPCGIEADKVQVEQVFLNLVRNAIEAAGAAVGSPQDRDRWRAEARARREGGGIRYGSRDPEGSRDSLFTPFFTTKPDGTGLGLSLSRTIVEAHGGRLTLECGRPGRTTFSMELP